MQMSELNVVVTGAWRSWVTRADDRDVLKMSAVMYAPAVVRTAIQLCLGTQTIKVVEPDRSTAWPVSVAEWAPVVSTQQFEVRGLHDIAKNYSSMGISRLKWEQVCADSLL